MERNTSRARICSPCTKYQRGDSMTLTNGRTSAYQWDYGLKAVTTEAVGTVARFANEHGSKAIPVEAVSEVIGDVLKVVYHIPDILLTTGRAIVMYHLGSDGETSVYTTSEDFLPVHEAPKPDDYIFTEEEIRTWQELDERLTEAEEDIVSLESGKADVVHTHTESDITDLKDYIVEPTSDGTNGQVLTTNGSGGRSWASIPTEVLRVVFTQSGSTVTADQTYETIYAAASAGKDVFGLLNGKVYYFGGVSSGAVLEFYAQDIFTASTGEIKVTTRNIGINSGNSVVYTETERLFAPKSHTHTESDIYDLGPYIPLPESASLGDSLVFGGTEWTAGALTYSDVGAAASSHTHTESDITNLGDYISDPSTKSEGQVLTYNGSAWVAADGGGGGGGTSDYTDLSNKPQINSVTLSGNKSSSDLGLADAVHTHSQYLTQETDPTVPSWAKASSKPSYTASEVGALPDDTVIPTKVSDLTNDSGFITTETDPTVPSWAKASTKPTYTAAEVGALPDDTEIPTKVSDLTNDSGFITTETDPTVPSWAKQSTKPSYTAAEVGAVPTTRTVNGKALSSDINLSIGDLNDVIEVKIGTDWGNDGTSLADIETAYRTGNMVIGYLDEDESTTAYPLRVFYSDGVHASSTNSYALFEGVGDDGKILRFYRHYNYWRYKHITPLPEPWAAAENEFVYYDGASWGTQYQTAVRIIYDSDGVSYITECLDHQQVPMVYRSTDRMIGTLCGVHYDDTDPYDLVPDKYFFRAVGESGVVETWSVEGSGDPWDVTWTTVETPLIPAPSSPTTGQYLSWNGSAWVAASLPIWNGSVT